MDKGTIAIQKTEIESEEIPLRFFPSRDFPFDLLTSTASPAAKGRTEGRKEGGWTPTRYYQQSLVPCCGEMRRRLREQDATGARMLQQPAGLANEARAGRTAVDGRRRAELLQLGLHRRGRTAGGKGFSDRRWREAAEKNDSRRRRWASMRMNIVRGRNQGRD